MSACDVWFVCGGVTSACVEVRPVGFVRSAVGLVERLSINKLRLSDFSIYLA